MSAYSDSEQNALQARYDDIWLVAGARTPFADYTGVLRDISPTDLGIYAAHEVFARSGVPAADVSFTVAANVAQASFDAYVLPRHIGLYSGVPKSAPSLLVSRICGSGFEAILTAADQLALGKGKLALCVGAESMSRNPIAAYTHRKGFRLGQVEFKDFLWEALMDTAPGITMGHTAENLAQRYGISREQVDAFAAQSFARALDAWDQGHYDDEVVAVENREWNIDGYQSRGLKLADRETRFARDGHVRETTLETLSKIRPAFGGVQTGGNSSAIVDGAAAVLVATGEYVRAHGLKPLARIAGGATVGVPPEIMGIGPAPAISAMLKHHQLPLEEIGRFEINEAFGAQYLAVEQELGLDRDRVNVHGGAIAIGHPLGATGVRLTYAVARQLALADAQYGISSACCGGGQGIAVLLENAASV